MMDARERQLRRWFSAWLSQDASAIDEVFSPEIVYSECYGPEYRGIEQIKRWFSAWNAVGRVLEWHIDEVYRDGDMLAVTWYFLCRYEGEVGGFNGVTLARFDAENHVISLREFQSIAEHEFPYGEEKTVKNPSNA